MPAKPIKLGHLHFDKKGDAEKHLKDMLGRYDVGDRVSADDTIVLHAAIARHPNAAAKIGRGISHFYVGTAEYGTKCFWITRIDNAVEKFSFRSCIYG
jgi:hypothetical protein